MAVVWRFLDRGACVLVPALSRFLGLHRNGDRDRSAVRITATGEFSSALSRDQPARFLATLAHLALEFHSRLPVYPARRQPKRPRRLCVCYPGGHGDLRALA